MGSDPQGYLEAQNFMKVDGVRVTPGMWREVQEELKLLRNRHGSSQGYDILIRCRSCGLVSYNPTDVQQLYCGRCHVFHDREPR